MCFQCTTVYLISLGISPVYRHEKSRLITKETLLIQDILQSHYNRVSLTKLIISSCSLRPRAFNKCMYPSGFFRFNQRLSFCVKGNDREAGKSSLHMNNDVHKLHSVKLLIYSNLTLVASHCSCHTKSSVAFKRRWKNSVSAERRWKRRQFKLRKPQFCKC